MSGGRVAPGGRWRLIWAWARAWLGRLGRDDIGSYAAAVTYNLLFAVFPLGLTLTGLLSWLHLPSLEWELLRPLQGVLAPEVLDLLHRTVISRGELASPGLVYGGGLGYLWGMSGALRQLADALDQAYEVPRGARRPAWRTYLLSLALAVAIGLAIVAAVVVATVGQDLVRLLVGPAPRPEVAAAAAAVRGLVLLALAVAVLAAVYGVLPDHPGAFRWLTPGTAVAIGGWLATSYAFSRYLARFNSYNRIYGSFAAAILLLLYLYFLSWALLLGAEVNAAFARRAGRPR